MVIWVGEGRGSKRPVRASATYRTIRWVHAQRAAQYQAFAGLHAASKGRTHASDLLPPKGKARAMRRPRHGTEFVEGAQASSAVGLSGPIPPLHMPASRMAECVFGAEGPGRSNSKALSTGPSWLTLGSGYDYRADSCLAAFARLLK